jgi:uncharacterized protein YecE (DUF72 family)
MSAWLLRAVACGILLAAPAIGAAQEPPPQQPPHAGLEALAREGLEALAGEGKLGALLIQFPVSFKNTSLNREYLEKLLRQFIEYPRVVEVRHDSWENPDTINDFMQRHVSFCNIDQPLIGRSLVPTAPAGLQPGSPFGETKMSKVGPGAATA